MKTRIFQPFQKVFTPRTPDSSYTSFGIYPPPKPIVPTPNPGDANQALLTESMGTGVFLQVGAYYAQTVSTSASDSLGTGMFLHLGGYIAPPP
jgi:hypothetical protein